MVSNIVLLLGGCLMLHAFFKKNIFFSKNICKCAFFVVSLQTFSVFKVTQVLVALENNKVQIIKFLLL
jgi:hypothetical protein